MGYAKVFDQIATSSLNELPLATRWLWIVLLSRANRNGQVHGTVSALARIANISRDEAGVALEQLSRPEPESGTQDEGGRRIMAIGGNLWQIVNYLKYRQMKDQEEVREQTRERVARYRERVTGECRNVTQCNAPKRTVTEANAIAEAEAEADAKRDKEREGAAAPSTPTVETTKRFKPPDAAEVQTYLDEIGETRFIAAKFIDYYQARGWRVKGGGRMLDWRACVRTWSANCTENEQPKTRAPGLAPGTRYGRGGMLVDDPPGGA